MRRTTTLTIALILALLLGAAHAQTPRIDGIAYAHVSLTITFGGNQAPTYTLEGSIFPRVEWTRQCFPGRCATGMATPLGYWYDPDHFATSPQYHKEEIDHLRQWEALGPAFLVAYFGTFGEAFEPYPTRNFAAIAATRPQQEWYRPENMWMPPAEMERSFPQLRIKWGGNQEPQTTVMTGYSELVTSIAGAIQGEDTRLTNDDIAITTLTPYDPLRELAFLAPDPDVTASNP